jgi:CheY-like chemotaxis protein
LKPNGSILVVEDNQDDAFFISRALRNNGLDGPLNVVNDGQAAVEFLHKLAGASPAANRLAPCLVLLDLNLPFKSGLEVLSWIREHPVWKTLIVIVLTSSTSEADREKAYSLGANSYVIKPADGTRLTEFGSLVKAYWLGWNELPPVCRTVPSATH